MVNIGDKFGKLTVIENSRTRIKNSYYYKVRCECGKEYYVQCSSLKNGRTTMCKECSNKNRRLNIPLGYRFGTWEVISGPEYINNQLRYRVRCQCGNERWMPASQIMDSTKYQSCRRCANGKIVSNFRESFINRLRGNAILEE